VKPFSRSRDGPPEGVAGAAGLLPSTTAGFVYGAVHFVDGGHDAMTRQGGFRSSATR